MQRDSEVKKEKEGSKEEGREGDIYSESENKDIIWSFVARCTGARHLLVGNSFYSLASIY